MIIIIIIIVIIITLRRQGEEDGKSGVRRQVGRLGNRGDCVMDLGVHNVQQ